MRKITLAAVMLLCVVLAGCQKESIADKDPKEAVTLVAENWGKLKDYQKNMTIQYETADGSYTDVVKLTANGDTFKKQMKREGHPEEAENIPAGYIWDIRSNGDSVLYTYDGTNEKWTSENWDSEEEVSPEMQFDGSLGFEEEDIINILGDQTSDGERVIKMEMTAAEAQENSVCTLWADLENGMPVRAEKIITDDQGQKTVSEIQFVSGKEVEKIKLPDS